MSHVVTSRVTRLVTRSPAYLVPGLITNLLPPKIGLTARVNPKNTMIDDFIFIY